MSPFLGFDWSTHAAMFMAKMSIYKVEMQMLIAPVMVYWTTAIFYDILDHLPSKFVRKCKLPEGPRKNLVTQQHVISRVILQHILQTLLGFGQIFFDTDCCAMAEKDWLGTIISFAVGMFVFDTWQYLIHRWMHVSTFMYKHVHSIHHKLFVPYSYGALYNHPLEAFFLDSVGAVVTFYITGMTCRTSMWFYAAASFKTVTDHSGYTFPFNPVYPFFENNSRYHNVHHDIKGLKKNFSQPFFSIWDRLLGTYADPQELASNPEKDS